MKENNLINKTAYLNYIACFYRCFMNTGSIFITGVKSALFMVHLSIAFGVEEELRLVRKIRKKC